MRRSYTAIQETLNDPGPVASILEAVDRARIDAGFSSLFGDSGERERSTGEAKGSV